MTSFRYQAIEGSGAQVKGVIEAEDRKAALHLLGERGLFPSNLEICLPASGNGNGTPAHDSAVKEKQKQRSEVRFGLGIKRKEITAFTGEMAAMLGAGI